MQHVKQGSLIAINDGDVYCYFLILGGSAFFGCQWAYAFHITSGELLSESEVLESYGSGFPALIDFIEERRTNSIVKISTKIDTAKYEVTSNLKARIDQYGGGHLWYIYSSDFSIIGKQEHLTKEQCQLPIASGLKSKDSISLIHKKWVVSKVVMEEGSGQYPV